MKKLLQLFVVPALCLVVFTANTSTASAQSACDEAAISNTGAESNNEIVCQNDETIVISCSNNTTVEIDVDQDSQTGTATVTQNTNAGDSTSGSASNSFQIDIDVENVNEGEVCATAASHLPTPLTPTPVTPEAAIVPEAAVVTPEVVKTVTSLPSTGNSTPLMTAGFTTAGVVVIALLSQVGISLYRKYTL